MNNKAKRTKIRMSRDEMIARLGQLTTAVNNAAAAEDPSEVFPVDRSEYNRLVVALLAGIKMVDTTGDRRSFHIGAEASASETAAAMEAIVAAELWEIVADPGTGSGDPDGVGPEKGVGDGNKPKAIPKSVGKKEAAELLFGPGGYVEGGVTRTDVNDIIAIGDALRRRKVTVITVTAAGIILASAVGVGLWLLLRDDSDRRLGSGSGGDGYDEIGDDDGDVIDPELGPSSDDTPPASE